MGGKGSGWPSGIDWTKVEWSRPTVDIAAELGVSGTAVRNARKRHAPGTGPETPQARFLAYLEAHRDALHGLTATEIQRRSGLAVGLHFAGQAVKSAGIRTSRAPHWDGADWRLPTADLARIWGVTAQSVEAARKQRRAPPARWRRNGPGVKLDPEYRAALNAERERARAVESGGG